MISNNIVYRKLSAAEFELALAIRIEVFVIEQKVPINEEQDQLDKEATHFGAFAGEKLVATGRLLQQDQLGKIGRMAVLRTYRGQGIGLALLNTIVAEAAKMELQEVKLGAQLHAIPFYEKAGFTAEGDPFTDAGLPHRMMRKKL